MMSPGVLSFQIAFVNPAINNVLQKGLLYLTIFLGILVVVSFIGSRIIKKFIH